MTAIDLNPEQLRATARKVRAQLVPVNEAAERVAAMLTTTPREQLIAAIEDFERRCAEQDARLRAREEERERRKLSSRIKRGVIIALSPVLVGLAWLFVLAVPNPKKSADAGED